MKGQPKFRSADGRCGRRLANLGRLLAALAIGLLPALASPEPAAAAWDDETAVFLILLNQYRAEKGAPPLAVDSKLQAAADWHADNQVNAAKCLGGGPQCSHSDTLGRSAGMRVREGFGYTGGSSENIAWGSRTAKQAFESWKASTAGHHENMLNPGWRAIGIGRLCAPGCFWVTNFGPEVSQPFAAPLPTTPAKNWAGTWTLPIQGGGVGGFGTLTLTQDGDRVTGTYDQPYMKRGPLPAGTQGRIEGRAVAGSLKLIGTWSQPPTNAGPEDAGTLEFTMAADGNGFQAIAARADRSSTMLGPGTRAAAAPPAAPPANPPAAPPAEPPANPPAAPPAEPPADLPPADEPPGFEPPADEPPGFEPPAEGDGLLPNDEEQP